jgi:hypothetical protein
MQDSGIVQVDRNKYLTLNRCPLGNYEYNMLNWCFALSQSQTGKFVSGWSISELDIIQAHEVLEQHKAEQKL